MLEYVILGFLMEGNMSGYDIKNFMSVSTANFFDASFGSIYPALKRLEGKRLILSREEVEGGKFKKVFEITEAGRKEFMKWLEEPADLSGGKPGHLLKAFFFNHLSKERARSLVEGFIASAQKELSTLEMIEPKAKAHADYFKLSTLHYGKDYYRFLINWIQDFLKKLDGAETEGGMSHENCCSKWKSQRG